MLFGQLLHDTTIDKRLVQWNRFSGYNDENKFFQVYRYCSAVDMNRLFGVGGIVGGLLKIFLAFVRSAADRDLLQTLYVLTDLGLILGLVGIYMLYRDRFSILGNSGFILALLGLSFISGPQTTLYGVSAYDIGFPVMCCGLALLAAGQLFLAGHPKLAPAIVLAGVVMSVPQLALLATLNLQILASVLIGIGFVLYGAYLIRQ